MDSFERRAILRKYPHLRLEGDIGKMSIVAYENGTTATIGEGFLHDDEACLFIAWVGGGEQPPNALVEKQTGGWCVSIGNHRPAWVSREELGKHFPNHQLDNFKPPAR